MSNSKQFSYFWRSAAEEPVTTVMGDRTEEQREYSQTQRDQRHREASEQKAKNPFARRKRVTLAVCVQARRGLVLLVVRTLCFVYIYVTLATCLCERVCVCELLCATHSTVFQPHAPVRSCQTFRIILRRPPGAKQRQNKLPDNIRHSPSPSLPASQQQLPSTR